MGGRDYELCTGTCMHASVVCKDISTVKPSHSIFINLVALHAKDQDARNVKALSDISSFRFSKYSKPIQLVIMKKFYHQPLQDVSVSYSMESLPSQVSPIWGLFLFAINIGPHPVNRLQLPG